MELFQIPDLVDEVIKRIDDPNTFLSALLVNKEWYQLGKSHIPKKKIEFIKQKKFVDRRGYTHLIQTYPNGIKNGVEKIYDDNILVVERTWKENKLNGTETRYESGNIYRTIPWVNDVREGDEIRYTDKYGGNKLKCKKIVHWKNNKRNKKDVYNQHNQLIGYDNFTGEKTAQRYKVFTNGTDTFDGIYINNEKHGVYKENGMDVLYLHGVPQLWYTTDKYEMFIYLGLGLLLLILIYKSYRQGSLSPIMSNIVFVSTAFTIIILPIAYAMYRGSIMIFK
jgi:hypothetical protein